MHEPFYNPECSYEENYSRGPFGLFAHPKVWKPNTPPAYRFLGIPVHLPFGIPAGPLVNAKFIRAAFNMAFSIAVYKTVRRKKYPCHPAPNVLSVHVDGDLTVERSQHPLVADADYREPLSITNSFGVPSKDPSVWQDDMKIALRAQREGELVIGSFQGTVHEGEDLLTDCVETAKMVAVTGVRVLELNLSCPNEGTANLLCFDTDRVEKIVRAIKGAVDLPLIIKIAYFQDQARLRDFVQRVGPLVDAISAINTIPAKIVDKDGNQALPGNGRLVSGVCGDAIRWAGLEMVVRLATLRDELHLRYEIVGVGGVMNPDHYQQYRAAGADAVMSATGAMWNPNLAKEIYERQ